MERVNIKIEGQISEKPCIYRMKLGKTKKFFIWKTNKLKASLPGLAKDLQRKIDKGCDDQDMFAKLAAYMRSNRVRNITIQILVETEDLVHIMHKEEEILTAASDDKRNCLNNSFKPYMPGWIKNGLDLISISSVESSTIHTTTVTSIAAEVQVEKVTAPSFFDPPKGTRIIPKTLINASGSDQEDDITLDDISAMAAALKSKKL